MTKTTRPFKTLVASLESEFDPQTENEAALVETLATARWRLMRTWAIERETLRLEIEKYDPAIHPPAERAALAVRSLSDTTTALDNLHRYEARSDRQYARALNLFLRCRAEPTLNLPNEPSPISGHHPSPHLRTATFRQPEPEPGPQEPDDDPTPPPSEPSRPSSPAPEPAKPIAIDKADPANSEIQDGPTMPRSSSPSLPNESTNPPSHEPQIDPQPQIDRRSDHEQDYDGQECVPGDGSERHRP